MSIEHRKNIELSGEITNFKGKATLFGEQLVGPFLRYGLENILTGTYVNYEEGFANEYISDIKEGYLPILVSSHQSHVDGVSLSLPAKTLTDIANEHLPKDDKLKGFALVLASSLYSGHQGAMMKGFFDEISPIIERRKLTPLLHTRPQDNQKYQMKTDRFSQYKDLIDAVKNGYALAVFPEGTTTAGKRNSDGQPNGMQDFMPSSIRMLISAAKEAGRKTMIIPVSITGGPTVHNPDTKLPTIKALKSGFGFSNPELLHIFLSNPMRSDQGELAKLYQARDWDSLNTVVADKIANHLPENERKRSKI